MTDIKMKPKKPKTTRSIRFDPQDLKDADRLGIDVSSVIREHLKAVIQFKKSSRAISK